MNWHRWIGKPHVTGADPVCDEGCDCLLMVTRIRDHLGLPAPNAIDTATLILLSQSEAFSEIHKLILPHLAPVQTPHNGAFTVFETPDKMGTAVMIDDGLLHVSHKRGVRWMPRNMLRNFDWYDWK